MVYVELVYPCYHAIVIGLLPYLLSNTISNLNIDLITSC